MDIYGYRRTEILEKVLFGNSLALLDYRRHRSPGDGIKEDFEEGEIEMWGFSLEEVSRVVEGMQEVVEQQGNNASMRTGGYCLERQHCRAEWNKDFQE